LLLLVGSRPALAYSWANHMKLSRDALQQLQSDPRYAFLTQDPATTDAFLWGSVFPDLGAMGQFLSHKSDFDSFKQKLLSTPFVTDLDLSMDQASAIPWRDTHDPAFTLFLVQEAEKSGYLPFIAFALGNLAHTAEDLHEDNFMIPYHESVSGAGDLGVGPAQGPSYGWATSREVDAVLKFLGDNALTDAQVREVSSAPWNLASGGWALGRIQRTQKIRAQVKHLYYLAIKDWVENHLNQGPFQSEVGFDNLCGIFDALLTLFPYIIHKDSLGRTAQLVKDRFVEFPWWLDAIATVLNTIVSTITLGQDSVYDLISLFVDPVSHLGAFFQSDPITDIVVSRCQGGSLEKAAEARYASNVEYQRLVASGLLDAKNFAPFDDAATFAFELIEQRQSSHFANWDDWITATDDQDSHAGGIGGLAFLMGPGSGYTAEPGLVVTRVRVSDPSTGKDVTSLHYPNDVGRALHLDVEVFAPVLDPLAQAPTTAPPGRDLVVRVRSDLALGLQDPVVAQTQGHVSADELVPVKYASTPRAKISLDFVAPADTGQKGIYLEADAGRGVFFTSNLGAFAALTAGRPSYAQDYAPYKSYPPALAITH
jgi:hypothetical protein